MKALVGSNNVNNSALISPVVQPNAHSRLTASTVAIGSPAVTGETALITSLTLIQRTPPPLSEDIPL